MCPRLDSLMFQGQLVILQVRVVKIERAIVCAGFTYFFHSFYLRAHLLRRCKSIICQRKV